jgi:YggT family protein
MSFVRLINLVVTLYALIIIARSLLSLLRVDPYHPVMDFLIRITEPVLAPIRQVIPPIGPIDISPLVALLLLQFIAWLVQAVVTALWL